MSQIPFSCNLNFSSQYQLETCVIYKRFAIGIQLKNGSYPGGQTTFLHQHVMVSCFLNREFNLSSTESSMFETLLRKSIFGFPCEDKKL